MFYTREFRSLFLLFVILSFFLTACDPLGIKSNGDIVTETRNEKDFHGIDVSVPGKIYAKVGQDYSIKIQVEESVLPYLETEVRDGRLHIYFSRQVWDVDDLVVEITAPAYDVFQLSGSGDIIVPDLINGNHLSTRVSGSGDIVFHAVQYDQLTIHISGSGAVDIEGDARSMEANVSGSGDLNALDCQLEDALVNVSGSGNVRCAVLVSLEAHISGSGDVEYLGNPSLDTHISGSGKIRKI